MSARPTGLAGFKDGVLPSALPSADESEPAITATRQGAWRVWLGVLMSAGLVAAILAQLGKASSDAFELLLRLTPTVWAVFALLYCVQPLADLTVFKRLWNLPNSGLAVLLRKAVLNEIVFGYSGEAYFYFWARRHAGLSRGPFGAIKDVNLLSGLMGNALTLVMLIVSAASLRDLNLPGYFGTALWSGVPVVAISLTVLVFAPRVFSLPRHDLVFIACMHAVRLVAVSGLTILIWRLAIPEMEIGTLLILLTIRLLIARIPLLPNKDLVFGNFVLAIVGSSSPVAILLAALAIATLVAHIGVISVVAARDLLLIGPRP